MAEDMYRDGEDDLDILPEPRDFDVNPETGKVAVVSRNFQDMERKELSDELEEAEAALEELTAREDAAAKARQEGGRRVAVLKSELEGFDEAELRARANAGTAGDGGADTSGAEEPEEGVELD